MQRKLFPASVLVMRLRVSKAASQTALSAVRILALLIALLVALSVAPCARAAPVAVSGAALVAAPVATPSPAPDATLGSTPDPILSAAPEKISAHVWVIEDKLTTPLVPNVGFIVGKKAILVVDTGLGPRNGKFVYDAAVKLAPRHHVFLVTTHFHPEHDLGASAFPKSTDLIRTQSEVEDISEFNLELAKEFSKRSKINAKLLKGAKYRKADLVFEDEKFLDLGDLDVRINALGANHTRGDTGVFVEGDRVLFSGDVAMKGQPSFASPHSSLAHWLETLDFLERLRPKIIVPSHGPIGDKSYIVGYRKYLTQIHDRVAALKAQNKSEEDIVKSVSDEMVSEYPDRARLEGAIRNAYREAAASPPAE